MNELLTALVAASKVGFDAPKCAQCWPCKSCDASGLDMFNGRCIRCDGTCKAHTPGISQYGARINVPVTGVDPDCDACHATGLDASDPERLIGLAMAELHCKRRMSLHRIGGDIDSDLIKQPPTDDDGDQKGQFATALLRLVARVGGAA